MGQAKTSGMPDPRRLVPRTDVVLADPRIIAAGARLSPALVLATVRGAQELARSGKIPPDAVADEAVARLPDTATSLRPVLNATGVVLHTNLGRAALSAGALEAVRRAAAYVDVEFDIETGARARRGRGSLAALHQAVPTAGDVLAVNNGAAALVLATTALASGREVIVSRGEMIEIGDGFRLPDLIASTGARLREVGTTNRTSLRDYTEAIGADTGCILKVHPSNFRVEGFTSAVSVAQLAGLDVPVIVDIGSGLLAPDPLLPQEPDAETMLADGADLVTCSGDKLLGGPQAGLVLGKAELVERLRRHPLARAVRVDKLTLAALEATLRGPATPTHVALHADPDRLRERCDHLCRLLTESPPGDNPLGFAPDVVASPGAVGGGGAPGLELAGWAVRLPEAYAAELRRQDPSVVCRVERGRTLVDLRCIPESADGAVLQAIRSIGSLAGSG
ncbi:MAG: L-seryl-tRNA(Ser) seleniumtransferase [Actinomycetota bacterium]|nr:L-seryl-tRNA(Ser) seleniumtransferase [Actinomycetota bacterium]